MSYTQWDYWNNRFGTLEETAEHYVYSRREFGFTVWYSVHCGLQMFNTKQAALDAQIKFMKQPVSEQWVKNMNAKLVQEERP